MKIYKMSLLHMCHGYDAYSKFKMEHIIPANQTDGDAWIMEHIYKNNSDVGSPYSDVCTPLHVIATQEYKNQPVVDICFLQLTATLVLSQRAVDLLSDLLVDKGTLLPLEFQGEQKYFVFRVERVINALDLDKCYGVEMTPSIADPERELWAGRLPIHAFHLDRVENESIFTIPDEQYLSIFVNQAFKDRVEQSDLVSSICFPAVWDSKDPDFIDEIFLTLHPSNWERLLSMWKSEANNTAQPTTPDAPLLSTDSKPESIEPFPESLREEQAEIIAAMLQLYKQQTQSDDLSPPAVVVWLQEYVEALRESGISGDELRDIGIDMATLWGEQIVQHYDWTWHILDDEYAVVAPDASLYILPIPFMAQFFVDREKDITVALVFNGLSRTDIVRAEAGAYVELR